MRLCASLALESARKTKPRQHVPLVAANVLLLEAILAVLMSVDRADVLVRTDELHPAKECLFPECFGSLTS